MKKQIWASLKALTTTAKANNSGKKQVWKTEGNLFV
jgi:hypothetical protein